MVVYSVGQGIVGNRHLYPVGGSVNCYIISIDFVNLAKLKIEPVFDPVTTSLGICPWRLETS